MHPRSPYNEYTDFLQLAKDCPAFAKYVTDQSKIDFKDPNALRELTKSLLIRDFGLQVELPEDRLCPTVPNRLNYILWVQDLLDSTSGGATDTYDRSRRIVGLDIGTGASCIYPLLGCASRESWNMIGTDIDVKSLQHARENVEKNRGIVGQRIAIFETTSDGPFFPLDKLGISHLDFTMCNPPFYESVEEMFASAQAKKLPPSSACTGITTEMVHAPGGEVSFVLRIFHDSLELTNTHPSCQNTWFTTMLGKLSSASIIISTIKLHTTNYAITEFKQGTTRRWGLAWSFSDYRPSQLAERFSSSHAKGLMPFPTEFEFDTPGDIANVAAAVKALGSELEFISWGVQESKEKFLAYGEAAENVWSRGARRARARGEKVESEAHGVKLGFRVETGAKEGGCRLVIRWVKGSDQVLFESFCGMVKRKVRER